MVPVPRGRNDFFRGRRRQTRAFLSLFPLGGGKEGRPRIFSGNSCGGARGRTSYRNGVGDLRETSRRKAQEKEMGKTNVRNWKLRCVGGGKKKKSNARRMNSLQRAPEPLN